jgi:hypothetical protein
MYNTLSSSGMPQEVMAKSDEKVLRRELEDCSKRRVNFAEIVHGEEWLGVHVGGEIFLLNLMYRFVDFFHPRKSSTR